MRLLSEYTENKWNILLRKELCAATPNEDAIRDLVKNGAEITGEFLIDAVFCYTSLDVVASLDVRYFKLLIELGADVNYTDGGLNCLYEASLSQRPELVELFIDSGANVNCIDTETKESLLEAVISEFYRIERSGREETVPLRFILNTLKRHGAMRTAEMN